MNYKSLLGREDFYLFSSQKKNEMKRCEKNASKEHKDEALLVVMLCEESWKNVYEAKRNIL